MTPHVTICIPNYQGKDALALTIESILKRTSYPSFSILVFDSSGETSQDRQYLRQQEQLRHIGLITRENRARHASAIKILLSHCYSYYALLLDSDVEILAQTWLTKLVELTKKHKALGCARLKQAGFNVHRSWTAPVFQPFCMLLNMEKYQKIADRINWQEKAFKLKDYIGKKAFDAFPQKFDKVYGDVGYQLAEIALFDGLCGLEMVNVKEAYPNYFKTQVHHYGGISSNHNRPNHPVIASRLARIREKLAILREE